MHGLGLRLVEVASLGYTRSEENTCSFHPFYVETMLFHGLSGAEAHGVVGGIDQMGKGETAAITSIIDMGEKDTNTATFGSDSEALCAGCGGRIADRYYLLAVDKQWHMRCLRCSECKHNLESELTCFSKDGGIYCKEDYYRRFSVQRCARCHLGISASEMVMRARDLVYHLGCFTCTACNKLLNTGDHFGMKDGLVYCRLHFETLLEGEYQTHFSHAEIGTGKAGVLSSVAAGSVGLNHCSGAGSVQKGRPRKRKGPGAAADLAAYNTAISCSDNDGDLLDRGPPYPAGHKSKRMRTSFKHHQLRTMKSYFAINHNPDAKDLKQLSQKTGLTKRVLQVWFQNARAKFRRNLGHQGSPGRDKASDGSTQQGGSPSGPSSEISNASLSPCGTPPSLMDHTNSTRPLGGMDPTNSTMSLGVMDNTNTTMSPGMQLDHASPHNSGSPPHANLTSLF